MMLSPDGILEVSYNLHLDRREWTAGPSLSAVQDLPNAAVLISAQAPNTPSTAYSDLPPPTAAFDFGTARVSTTKFETLLSLYARRQLESDAILARTDPARFALRHEKSERYVLVPLSFADVPFPRRLAHICRLPGAAAFTVFPKSAAVQ